MDIECIRKELSEIRELLHRGRESPDSAEHTELVLQAAENFIDLLERMRGFEHGNHGN